MTKILIASQDLHHQKILNNTLRYHGFVTECSDNPETILKFNREILFNLILIDHELFMECNDLKNGQASIIVMAESYDQLPLENKIDDYILKPFGLQELKVVFNKQLTRKPQLARPIVYGDLKIDVKKSMVTVKDKILSLGIKEMEILIMLAQKAGRIVTMDHLFTEKRIEALTKKLMKAADGALQIKGSRGIGYKLINLDSCG